MPTILDGEEYFLLQAVCGSHDVLHRVGRVNLPIKTQKYQVQNLRPPWGLQILQKAWEIEANVLTLKCRYRLFSCLQQVSTRALSGPYNDLGSTYAQKDRGCYQRHRWLKAGIWVFWMSVLCFIHHVFWQMLRDHIVAKAECPKDYDFCSGRISVNCCTSTFFCFRLPAVASTDVQDPQGAPVCLESLLSCPGPNFPTTHRCWYYASPSPVCKSRITALGLWQMHITCAQGFPEDFLFHLAFFSAYCYWSKTPYVFGLNPWLQIGKK